VIFRGGGIYEKRGVVLPKELRSKYLGIVSSQWETMLFLRVLKAFSLKSDIS